MSLRQMRVTNAFVFVGILAVFSPACRNEPSESLTVVSYGGGAYQQSHIESFLHPFEEAEEVRVTSVVWNADYGRLLEMVRSNNVPWDVVEVTAAQFGRGTEEGIYHEMADLPSSVFLPIQGGPPASPFGVPNVYWSTVLAWPSGRFSDRTPETWKDFWDLDAFPGPRALYDDPRGNLEFALLADGVPRESLYPLDVERAFRRLDQIKPHVRVWWTDGTEPVRLLLTGEVALSSAWSGRIYASEEARAELDYSWNGAAHELDYWVIPNGSRNSDLAFRFIAFASDPTRMAKQATMTAYGPANALALAQVPDSVKPHLPTNPENWAISFLIDSDWWTLHEDEMSARWIRWKNE
jgi:putative spermidine/putrescine transport system substrate-binding protein